MDPFINPINMLIRETGVKIVEAVADSLIDSPFDQTAGANSEWEMDFLNAVYESAGPLNELVPPLHRVFGGIEGLRSEHLQKVIMRLSELPVGRIAEFQFQAKERSGNHTEIQVFIAKHPGIIQLQFRSTEKIIDRIADYFEKE